MRNTSPCDREPAGNAAVPVQCTELYGHRGERRESLLAASPEALVCYLNYAGTDYIDLGSGYLKPGTDGWNNVVVMLKKGYMTDMLYENGNALGRFDAEPAPPEDADAVLKEFSTKYWAGEQQ